MKADSELEAWRGEWLAQSPAPDIDLAKKVAHESRRLRWTVAVEVAVTVLIGGFWTLCAVRSPQPAMIMLAVATWVFFAAAWTFALLKRRGCWSPASQTTAAFTELSLRRSRSAIAAAKFGLLLYFCEILFCFAWIYHHEYAITPPFAWSFLRSGPVVTVAAATPFVIGGVIWYVRSKRREVACLEALRCAVPDHVKKERPTWTAAASFRMLQERMQQRIARFPRRRRTL